MNARIDIIRSGLLKKALKETAAILLITAVSALAVNALRPHPLPVLKSPPQPPPAAGRPMVPDESDPPAISIASAVEHYRQQTALFVDARLPADYAAGHIEGAVNLPEHRFDERIGPFLETTDPATPIITYCDGMNCPLSKNLAQKLVRMGFEKVYHLPDGWAKWRTRGLPVEQGDG